MDYTTITISDRKSITMNDFIAHIQKYIPNETIKTIVDAGSMNGEDTSILQQNFPRTSAYSIEGLPSNYHTFIKNKSNIIGINAVIANYDGECTYYEKNINGIHGIYNRGNQYGTTVHILPCYKLSTIMKNNAIDSIDVLKVDVEGATYDLLLSLDDKLNDIKIMHIETETYPFFEGQTLHTTVCDFLVKNNFKLVDITFAEITPGKFQSDSVWINNKFIIKS